VSYIISYDIIIVKYFYNHTIYICFKVIIMIGNKSDLEAQVSKLYDLSFNEMTIASILHEL